ncbi:LON peptidase substrate-binding domain-containing protein [Rubrobacter indicoceani]|uniref:LON peptidase substrate-binding domain-containing protein n=1 Tax=Rubrobacter indicoceani TaxID=2051957 RepID=UPI000E5B8162|nr:LON peptidase substrate-binding domain-containing protein [Rubrobacter indicoceani]
MPEIPLFPLNVVLVPGAPLPLHIFEERYKQMVEECLRSESEFGMVLSDEQGTRTVGCTAKISELVERYEDGRLLVLTEGVRRFSLGEVHSDRAAYLVGEVEFIEEDAPRSEDVPLAEECVALLTRVVEAATESPADIEIEPTYRNLSFAIAGRIDFGTEHRQRLLETQSERERLEMVRELLNQAVKRLEAQRDAEKKSRTNGHLRDNWKPGERPG